MDEREEKDDRLKYDYSKLPKWIEDAYVVDVDIQVEKGQQRIQLDCARCKESWSCPVLNAEQRKELAEYVRRAKLFDAQALLMQVGFTFAEAKPTMLHITFVPGKCHKCKRALMEDSRQVVCRCRALNLNW